MRLFELLLLALTSAVSAQFGFFDQMFGGGGGSQQHHRQQPQNVPSDSSVYRANYARSHCDKYLCPDTLACVHFPHHCPCPWPSHEDKFELAEGQRICVSKGGFKAGEAARKVELARKGLL
ncbi:40ede440-0735-4183-b084-ca33ad43cab8 [Thermothielavioides terrestris]|uniref:Long chronological lifespan protein 2 n=1 Tax=Thermothielavioides terrestris TaxID=2587410 RepID=A0A3S4F5B8_9PEZI|nr:40ede440-0735-4183-b084-ca33ad43cab8 [Thermothielavioides terrestris]